MPCFEALTNNYHNSAEFMSTFVCYSHEELLTSGGIYYTMWTEQQKSREKEESNSKSFNAASWSPSDLRVSVNNES